MISKIRIKSLRVVNKAKNQLIKCFLAKPALLSPPALKIFITFAVICEKSSTQSILSDQFCCYLLCLCFGLVVALTESQKFSLTSLEHHSC